MSDSTRILLWVIGCLLFPPLALIPLYRWWKARKLRRGHPFQLGLHHHKAERYDDAIHALQQVPAEDEHHVRSQLLAGECFMRQGDFRTAAEVLKRATLKGNDPTAEEEKMGRYWLGRCYQELDHASAAEQEYRKVYSVDSRYRDVAQRLREVAA